MDLELASFALGFLGGVGILVTGMLIGRTSQGRSIKEILFPEKPVPLEDIPGTDEYFEKAKKSPEDGGHKDPFESSLDTLFSGE
jgi:hypothetical protein